MRVRLRVAYVSDDDRRMSSDLPRPGWTETLILEYVFVPKELRRQGRAKRLIAQLMETSKSAGITQMIVEGVINNHLSDALTRWGWECDERVMDFFKEIV